MANAPGNVCASCGDALVIQVLDENNVENEQSTSSLTGIPVKQLDDDVHLTCNCHFHWQCLLDAYSVTECPVCHRNLITILGDGRERIICNLKNEGGYKECVDILDVLIEETHLKAFPEERKGRALLEFCKTGDVQAIVGMLDDDEGTDDDEDGVTSPPVHELLRYQCSLGSMESGLHIAVGRDQEEVAWLLLFLASTLDLSAFPPAVLSNATDLDIVRPEQTGLPDVRSLVDSNGGTAEDNARVQGGIWKKWVDNGLLRAP